MKINENACMRVCVGVRVRVFVCVPVFCEYDCCAFVHI